MFPKLAKAAAVTLAATGVFSVVGAGSAFAATVNGAINVTDPSTNNPLNSGGSTKDFTFTFPAQTPPAHCSGDSANQQFQIYSYVIPAPTPDTPANVAAAVQGINFLNSPNPGPAPANYLPVMTDGGAFYEGAQTAPNTGQIVQVPLNLQWKALNDLLVNNSFAPLYATSPSGFGPVYEVGIACADKTNHVVDNFNTELTFTQNAQDPGGFVWSVNQGGGQTPEIPYAVGLPLAGIGLLGGAALFARRRSAKRGTAATA